MESAACPADSNSESLRQRTTDRDCAWSLARGRSPRRDAGARAELGSQRSHGSYRLLLRALSHPPRIFQSPDRLFSIPLFVRLYCEAVNPDHSESVGVEALPSSLVAVFELYR